mgnify:FL=1|jgi:glycosyltransferase
MNNPLISIIIPAYNVEQYLTACLSSIEQQTYQNFEVILIDDGSIDSTGAMCDTVATKDDRFKVIHQKNQGVSVARNKGIEKARGEYIAFIDSDDKITPEYLSSFSLKNDIEIQGHVIYEKNIQRSVIYSKRKVQKDVAKVFCLGPFNSAVWGKIFKTSIIKDNKIVFPVNLCFSEDTIFLLQYIKHCKTLAVFDAAEYIYIKHSGSLTDKKYPMNDMMLKEKMIVESYKLLFPESKFQKDFLREVSLSIISKYYFYYDLSKKEFINVGYLRYLADIYLNKFDKFLLFIGMSYFAYYVRWRHRIRVKVFARIFSNKVDTLLNAR